MYNSQGSRTLHGSRASPIVGRCPTDIVVSAVPVHPSRSPHSSRYPVPPESGTPVPTAIVDGRPTPWLIRKPSPSADWEPHPSSVPVWAPISRNPTGNPDMSVRKDIGPLSVVCQFVLKIFQFSRQIPLGHAFSNLDFPPFAPSVETVLCHSSKTRRTSEKVPVDSFHPLCISNQNRAGFSCRL